MAIITLYTKKSYQLLKPKWLVGRKTMPGTFWYFHVLGSSLYLVFTHYYIIT